MCKKMNWILAGSLYIAVQSLNIDRMNNTEQILAELRKYKEEMQYMSKEVMLGILNCFQ